MGTKYKAKYTYVNNIKFQSRKEASRYAELLLLERAGEISELKCQEKFVLIPAQREPDIITGKGKRKPGKLIEREVAYYADFYYLDENGEPVVEDVKGYKQGGAYALYTIKRKLMLWRYGIRIKEV